MKETTVLRLSLDQVRPDPQQVRRRVDDGPGFDRLVASVGRLGQLQPIRVRATGEDRFVIVDGERRWRALCQLRERAGPKGEFDFVWALAASPAAEHADGRIATQMGLNLSEGLSRPDRMRAIIAYARAARADGGGPTQPEIAETLGVAPGEVRMALELSEAPRSLLSFCEPESGRALPLSAVAQLARAFARLVEQHLKKGADEEEVARVAEAEVCAVAESAQAEGWGRRELERQLDKLAPKGKGKKKRSRAAKKKPGICRDAALLVDRLAKGTLDASERSELVKIWIAGAAHLGLRLPSDATPATRPDRSSRARPRPSATIVGARVGASR